MLGDVLMRFENVGRPPCLPDAMISEPIVVVADSNLASELAGILRAAGHMVHTTAHPLESVGDSDGRPPALILLQGQLEDASGCEICRRLRRRKQTRRTPILLITGDPEEERRAFSAGASDYLSVPLRPAEVLARVQAHLELGLRRRAVDSKSGMVDRLSVPRSAAHEKGQRWIRLAMRAARMYAFAWDPQTDEVRRSHESAAILGRGVGSMADVGANFFQMVHPQDRERFRDMVGSLSPVDDTYDIQFGLSRPDGVSVNLRESAKGFFDEGGRLTRVIGMVADVTEQVSARNDLEQGRTHLLQLIQKLPIAVAMADPAGRIEYINERFTECFGYRLEEISSVEAWWERAYPDRDYRCRVIETWTRAVDTANRLGENIPPSEYRITGKDGIEHLVNVSGAVFGSRKLILFDDITERKHSEVALRESEGRFRAMADSAPVMLWVSGPDKRCTFFNKGWLAFTGRSMAEELGDGWAEGLHPEDASRCLALYSAAFDAREPFQMEYRLRRSDGEYRWILESGAPRFAADGTFAGYVASGVDVTDLKLNQEQMLAAQKLESLGVLAGGIAHDFHNFLGCILADAVVTMSEVDVDSPARDGLERIEAVAVRAAQIVRQITEYTGHQPPDVGLVDLARLIREMVYLLRVCVPKEAKIEVDLPPSLLLRQANATQLRQAVMNLIINAGEAIGDRSGTITITGRYSAARLRPEALTTHSERECISLEISDTGIGMTEEVQKHIFNPLFSTKGAGRGLGLAAIQAIVRSHGGTIEVGSTPGSGTRFQILLPVDVMPLRPESATKPAAAILPPTRGSILIVEDEETLRISVARMLRKQGYSVLEAGDGNLAVELIRDPGNDIAVVLLDITLPGKSSPEVFAELRRARPGVKVILTSAYGRESMAGPLKAFEPESFIRKPYQFSDLVTVVRDALPQGNTPPDKSH